MKKAFTLIEMLVVVGVIAFILPVVFTIVFAILRQQAKIYALQEVKRQGDFILGNIRTNLKNSAATVHSGPPDESNLVCNTANSSNSGPLYFRDRFNNNFWYSTNSDIVASNSSILEATLNLTNDKVRVESISISCERQATFSSPVISISYTVDYDTSSTRAEDKASFNYQTKIQLRSY